MTWSGGGPPGSPTTPITSRPRARRTWTGGWPRWRTRSGWRLTERLCREALDTYDPVEAEARRVAAAEARHVDVHIRDADRTGTVDVVASVDTADALDLEAAVAQAAAELKAGGSTESLDVRRSMALGVIARHYLAVMLNTGREAGPLTKPRQVVDQRAPPRRRTPDAATPPVPRSAWNKCKSWCTHPDTQVIIRPIRDLNHHIRVDAYEVPDRLADQVDERDGSCIHPWCTRPARGCDKDHCQPYDRGGTTSSDNVAPLCRRHHRAKTHGQLALPVPQTGRLPVAITARPLVPPRRHRHHRPAGSLPTEPSWSDGGGSAT